jgi:transposase-like protein
MAARKRFTAEEIIGKLREAEVALANGKRLADVCRQLGVTEVTYYRWRREFGGLKVDQARRLKDLERENARLRRAVADLTLDKLILKEAAEGNWEAPPVAGRSSIMSAARCGCPSGGLAGRSIRRGRRSGVAGADRTTRRR